MSLAIQQLGIVERLFGAMPCKHLMLTGAHNSVGITPRTMTGRQKMALMLKKANYSDSQVAEKLGISRVAANRLINRGRRAQRAALAITAEMTLEIS